MTDIANLGFRVDTSDLRRSQTELRNTARAGGNTERQIGRSSRNMESGFNRVRQSAAMVRTAIAAIGGAVVVRQIQNAVQASIELGNEIDKVSQASGVTAERVQELRFAFGQLADISDGQVNQALIRFQQSLGEAASGSERAGAAFRQMGVDLNQDTQPALESTLRALARMENDARRTDAAARLFGRTAGPQLAAALGNGTHAVEELAAALRDDGGAISAEHVAAAAELADAIAKVNTQVDARRASAVLEYKNEILSLVETFGSLQTNAMTAFLAVSRFNQAAFEMTRIPMTMPQLMQSLGGLVGLGGEPEETVIDITRGRDQPMFAERPDIDLMEHGIDVDARRSEAAQFFEQTRTEAEQLEAQIARVQELSAQGWFRDAGIDDQEILRRLQEQLDSLGDDSMELARQIQDAFAIEAGGAIEEMFARGEVSMENFANSMLRQLARIMAQLLIIQPLMEAISGPVAGFVGGITGNAPSQGRANGGAVTPGTSYMVGEQGPERFVAAGRGHIEPNKGGGNAVNIQVVDQRGQSAPPVDVQRQMSGGRETIKVIVRGEIDQMFADGSIDRRFAAARMPVTRRGAR